MSSMYAFSPWVFLLFCKFKVKPNNAVCQLEKPNILSYLQILGMLYDEGLSSLGPVSYLSVAKCYVALYTSQSHATGFSIMLLILNH